MLLESLKYISCKTGLKNGKPSVIEYTEISKEMAEDFEDFVEMQERYIYNT